MHDQLKNYFDTRLSKCQCGFRKGFSMQHCLLAMIEKLRKSRDSGGAYVSALCKKASQKLDALSRITSCMTFDQRGLILDSFITSHFSYCPIVWMFHRRKLNEKISHILERALRIVYKDFKSSFQELLKEDNSLNIHHRNLQKSYHLSPWMMLSPELMNVFKTILPPNNFAS